MFQRVSYCSQWFKDTNLKANHNVGKLFPSPKQIVPNGSKILIWKQITTIIALTPCLSDCSQWFKDTNLKANHNEVPGGCTRVVIVPNGSKILIWKQITTVVARFHQFNNCSQWFKDTNLKANHNRPVSKTVHALIVPNGSKILIWKQITTYFVAPNRW